MIIRPDERQYIADICREEIDEATRRIFERLSKFEHKHLPAEDEFAGVRRFYEDLADKPWTEADEECLNTLKDADEGEIKAMLRAAFRRARLYPVPNFAYLIGLTKRQEPEGPEVSGVALTNPDAIPAAARESLANLLEKELTQATADIVSRLRLEDAKATSVRERLEDVQGMIIGRFTPLV